jgi:tetratricopeptide (TPR) repeat protein
MDQAGNTAGQPVKRGTMAHDHDVAMLQAESAVQRRDQASLQRCAARLEELARRDDHRFYLAIAQRAWGVAHHLAGELEKAEASLNQALETFANMDARWQAGRTFYELGELAVSRDDRAGAQQNFEKALGIFEALAARPDAERARRALAKPGWLPPSPSISSMN